MNNEMRWKQRFENFEKCFRVFQRRKDKYEEFLEDEGYQMALVQAFEILFELSWKVIKEAFRAELIQNAEDWMDALEQRNNTTHIYNEKILKQVLEFIQVRFYPIVRGLYFDLKKEL